MSPRFLSWQRFSLQDVVNQIGRRLGYSVVDGRYRGTKNQVGFDGLWKFPDGHTVIVEVKTTDAYRIDLGTVANYRRELIGSAQVSEECSSILMVVGRQDTGDLEAQIRGSRHAWDVRLISVEALLRLMFLKERVDDPTTIRRICDILKPREFTRLDEIVDIIFSTTEETVQPETEEPEEVEYEGTPKKAVPVAFHAEPASPGLSSALASRWFDKRAPAIQLLTSDCRSFVRFQRCIRLPTTPLIGLRFTLIRKAFSRLPRIAFSFSAVALQRRFLRFRQRKSFLGFLTCGPPS